MPKIAMATVATGSEFKKAVSLGIKTKRDYCRHHGYEFLFCTKRLSGRDPKWDKIRLLIKEIPRFDCIFWSDGDVIITNPKLSFDDILSRYPVTEKTTFLLTRDSVGNINTGNFFVFNRPNALALLERIWDTPISAEKPWQDNQAFITCYESNREFRDSVLLDEETPYVFNGYCIGSVEKRFRPESLLLHFAGINQPGIIERMMEHSYLCDRSRLDRMRLGLMRKMLFGRR